MGKSTVLMLMSLSALASAPKEISVATCGGSPSAEATANGSKAGIFAGRLVACRQRHLDLHERHVANHIVVADMRDRGHLHAPPVPGPGDLARRRKPRVLASSPDWPSSAAAVSFMISGGVASCSRPSSAASSATPIRMLEVTPVRNVPESHRAEISRLSGGPLRPSASSGGSFPSSAMASLSFSPSSKATSSPTRSQGFHELLTRQLPAARGEVNEGQSRSPGLPLSTPLHTMRA